MSRVIQGGDLGGREARQAARARAGGRRPGKPIVMMPLAEAGAPPGQPRPGRRSRAAPSTHFTAAGMAADAPAARQRGADPLLGNLLLRLRPDLSAAISILPWQLALLVGFASFAGVLAWLEPAAALQVLILGLTVPFLLAVLLRVLALRHALTGPRHSYDRAEAMARLRASPDDSHPTYAVLVALYDEADVIPGLVEALAAFDYPASRLAIRLVVEEKDARTQAAIAAVKLPVHFSVVVVPDGKPRTKPRALNYALSRTPGEFVVIYDAEDLPEPDQLRRALAAFAAAPPGTGCLQARLNIVNHDESWLTRQFTIEYTALFDVMLPALEHHGIPIPLGGTSNHFRRTALEAALAWDPYNVTEDADLGIRFARFGLRVGVIASTTWEEAPATRRVWLGQRTRWLKGWMQTYLVHMRSPGRLLAELGLRQFLGFQLFMVSTIVAPLVHPWFYVVMAADAWNGTFLAAPDGLWSSLLWWLAVVNLSIGYVSAMLIGLVGVVRRRRARLAASLLLLPLYWLLVSVAAYRALVELATAPHHWQKTPHRARPAGVARHKPY